MKITAYQATIDAGTTGTHLGAPGNGSVGVPSDRIRVLQFLVVFAWGGTERQVVNLARGLDPSRFALHFGCLHRWGALLGEVTEQRIPVAEYRINKLYTVRAWMERLRFARDLHRDRIQVVHSYNFHANAFAIPAARLSGVPVVASIRDTGGYLSPLQERAQRFVCSRAQRIAVNAEAVRQYLIVEGHDPKKIVVVRNGVDLSRFPGRRGDGRLRQELGLPAQVPLVAVQSRLIRLKGLEHFLEAAALVAVRLPDVRFLVVGGDAIVGQKDGVIVTNLAYRNELERHAARLGLAHRVVFTGFRLDVPEILSEVAVSVLPSVGGEGLSNSVLEAMAAGVPVVATNVGGNAEAVEDGVTGFLVPPQDAHALARGICHLLETPNLMARFGAAGRERVARDFSMERYVRETEAIYSELRAEAGRRRPAHGATPAQEIH